MTAIVTIKRYFIFSNDRLLVPIEADLRSGVEMLANITQDIFTEYAEQTVHIHGNEHVEHHLVDMQKEILEHESVRSISLREVVMMMPKEDFQHVAQAWQYAVFLRTHQFCGRCGSRMDRVSWEMVKRSRKRCIGKCLKKWV